MTDERTATEARDLAAADHAMARYAEGDAPAFGEVFQVLGPRIMRFLRRLTGSDELSRDLFQETLLRVHQARGAFRPGSAVLPWAYTIARNVFLDSARARRRAPPLLPVDDGSSESAVSPQAESEVAARQTAQRVDRVLASMSAARREAFVLLRFEGLSVADAAEVLGVSENAVKLRAFQAYELLRAALRSDRK